MRKPTLAVLAVLLSACAGAAPPRDQFYRLDIAEAAQAAAKPLQGTVEVGRFSAEGLVSQRGIVYSPRSDSRSVQNYSYQFWNEPPGVMLRDELVEHLRAARAAERIVTGELRVPPDWVVQGRIKRFEHLTGNAPAVLVEVEMGLTRLRGNQLAMLETYRIEVPAADGSVPAAVDAFHKAVAQLFAQFTADLGKIAPVQG